MTQTVKTEAIKSVNFSNLVLKQWLHRVGTVRRCKLLRKLKTELQNHGLSQKQVQRGLIQLAKKPRVVLEGEPIARRCGSKQVFLNDNEEKSMEVAISCKTDTAVLQHQSEPMPEYVQKSDTMKIDTENKYKQNENEESIKSCKTDLTQGSFVTNRNNKSGINMQSAPHSSDKTSKQLDLINAVKSSRIYTSESKDFSVNVTTDITFKLQNYLNNETSFSNRKSNEIKNLVLDIKSDVNCVAHETSSLIFHESDENLNNLGIQDKKNHRKINSSSYYDKQNTNFTKLNINKKLEAVEGDTNTKAHPILVKMKHSLQENYESKTIIDTIPKKDYNECSDIKAGNTQVNLHKRRSYETISVDSQQKRKKIHALTDKPETISRNKKKKLIKFRQYFGECLSISEDEQEQGILQTSFKRRKKKFSVDSCDSGVCINEKNVAFNYEESLRDIQTTVPDSIIMQEELKEDMYKKAFVETDASNTLQEDNSRNENIKSTDQFKDVMNIINTSESSAQLENSTNTIERESSKSESRTQFENATNVIESESSKSESSTQLQNVTNLIESESSKSESSTQLQNVTNIIESEYSKSKSKMQLENATNIIEPESSKSESRAQLENATNIIEPESSKSESRAQLESATNVIESESSKSKNSTCKVNNIQLDENVVNTESVTINNVTQSAEMHVSLVPCSISESKSEECNAETVGTTCLSDFQKSDLNNHDLNEILQMNFNGCQITSDGNVLSIQEDITENIVKKYMNLSNNENSTSKLFTAKVSNSNKDKESIGSILSAVTENSETVTSFDTRKDIETVSINNTMCNTLENINETALQEPQLKIPSNQVHQARLRVLSSSELGSRWCPTPVNCSLPSNTKVSSNNHFESVTTTSPLLSTLLSETVPAIYASAFIVPTSVPVSTSTLIETSILFNNTTKSNLDPKISSFVHFTLLKIYGIIRRIRISVQNISSKYDELLCSKFKELKKILKCKDDVSLIRDIIVALNRKLFEMKPLNLQELFHYTPSLETLYMKSIYNKSVNPNEHQQNVTCYLNEAPTITKKPTLHKNILCSTTPMQTNFQNINHMSARQQQSTLNLNQASVNMKPKHPQTLQENVLLQKNNIIPNNTTADCNMKSPLNMQHTNYKQRTQKPFGQQKTSHVYMAKQKSVSNVNASQSISRQQQVPNSFMNGNQPRQYPYMPTVNTYANQQYIPNVAYTPEANTFYTAGPMPVPNCPVQQNMNPANIIQQQNVNIPYNKQYQNINFTHTIPLQNINSVNQQFQTTLHRPPVYNVTHGTSQTQFMSQISQNTPINNYISQTPQTGFGSVICQPTLKSAQQNEQMYQQIPLQTQIKVPSNFLSVQKVSPASSYSEKSIKSTTIENSKDCTTKAGNITQISLESMTKHFSILKCLSNIQKIMLLRQLNIYFGCTTWLEQEFSQENWQRIQSDRTLLLNFHTLLKHNVDKIMKDLQNKHQLNMSRKDSFTYTMTTDDPKEVRIAQESGVHCEVDTSNVNQVQSKATNCTPQQNLNVTIVEKQSVGEQETMNTSENIQLTEGSQIKVLLNSPSVQNVVSPPSSCSEKNISSTDIEHSKDCATKTANITQVSLESMTKCNNDPMPESSKTKTTLKYTENCSNEIGKDLQNITKERTLNESEKVLENISCAIEKDELITLGLEESNIDMLQQNPHLVTVKISSDSDYVTVVDYISAQESTSMSKTEIIKDYERLQNEELNTLPVKDTTPKTAPVFTSPDINTEHSNDSDSDIFIVEENSVTCIMDVRSISLEAFEKIEIGNNKSTIVEGNIEEEEIKVCLYCSKPSSVVCSICLEAKYCSKECSGLHWQEHYKTCKPVQKSMYL
nr:uncharacterized protein LOC116430539 isoform X1 [Nomia melanderi]XP_031840680.1 uncharacterized protein LOC116430539 isoform X1 [Nomia melanderi]XP_031840681.1 uncharacterized protein LOC116430539 isoform X1 [Nomia melanderi]